MFKYIKKIHFLKIPIFFVVGNSLPFRTSELEHSERQNRVEIKETKEKKAQKLSYYHMHKLSLYYSWYKMKIYN